MEFSVVAVTPLQQNCTVLWCPTSGKGAVVDPGGDLPEILAAVEREGVTVEKVLLTHAHIDHVGAAGALADHLHIPIEGPEEGDRFLVEVLAEQSRMFDVPLEQPFVPDRWLTHGDRVSFGQVELEVLHCPGHTPGHLVYFHRPSKLALTGDVLFEGSIGRTDFPGGDHEGLLCSIRQRLWPLGSEVAFVPGHGPMSTFGQERQTNPFVADGA
jgi:glyoxylase-like metal-dependent hydrolase (beta-lactamase superfamily II)